MHSYRPDWLGAILAGVFVGLSILVTTRLFPRKRPPRRAIMAAGLIGVALAFIFRNVLRHFGI